jgi:LacI family transcriptional regulator, kdg operon repressor
VNKRRRITIKDVAREAGVSITTVSRYLNQNYEAMGEETRARIEEVIDSLGYLPNKLAQGLKGTSRNIAVVVVNIGYPFCVSVIRSISKVLHDEGYNLMVWESDGDPKREEEIIRSLVAQNIGGLIIQTDGENNGILAETARMLPVVLIDREFAIPNVINVLTNDQEASNQLACRLFQEGYQKIIYVTEPLHSISTRAERLQGYKEACQQFQKEPCVIQIERGDKASLKLVVDRLDGQPANYPFSIYTANGLIMLELYPLLKELSFSTPNPMGLATFDEPDWAKLTSPPLTCVRHPTEEMGQYAAISILQHIKNGGTFTHHIEVIDSTVLLSDSTRLKN